jgi:transcription-repair coupling factor (superfamily II helicase)
LRDRKAGLSGNIVASVSKTPALQDLRARLEKGGVVSLAGVHPAAQPFLGFMLGRIFPERAIVLVTDGVKSQESFQQDLETWMSFGARAGKTAGKLLYYPSWEILPHESRLPHADVISERLETLVSLTHQGEGTGPTIVTNVTALLQKTFPPAELAAGTRLLKKDERIEPLDLIEWLEDHGYEPEAQVTSKGEIALRGGILDVYPPPSPWPVRIEFFGDEIESLRQFDPHTQISRENIDEIAIPPAGELAFLKKKLNDGEEQRLATLVEYLPPESIVVICEPAAVVEAAEKYEAQIPAGDAFFCAWTEFLANAEAKGFTILNAAETEQPDRFAGYETGAPAALSQLARPVEMMANGSGDQPFLTNLEAFRPQVDRAAEIQVAEAQRREFFAQLHRWLRQGFQVHVFCNNEGERQRFEEIWAEYGFEGAGGGQGVEEQSAAEARHTAEARHPAEARQEARTTEEMSRFAARPRPTPRPVMDIGSLARGFICDAARVVVVTDAEIFGRYKVHRPRRLKSVHAAATRSALDIDFGDLEPGDYVVHLQHGIGRYRGLEILPGGRGQSAAPSAKTDAAPEQSGPECLVIEYAPPDFDQPAPKLYVPVTEAHLVSKYVGTGKARPQLHTLGGTRWQKAKVQAESAVRDLASEMLAMQAARESLPGHAFGEDTPWQREFEGSFVYEETPDQLKAINEAKKDMASTKPMDRLICGDVGYGKTEVAIRAAFKAVMGGKQVAFLVPTTILAQQHYNTLRERMADYPIRVEQLSRFRTRTEQKRVLQGLAEGAVDIVVGTHRLVQEDVGFKDLGLVIIDEEQRFGVMHKEKLKLLRKLVDVLTLSATPIPRTLYLALTGARDMSTIETPPQDRLPVETIVTQFDERTIRDAVQREINRGGQTYFLHNRVLDIYNVAERIRTLVPQARIVVGHGQMDSDELEDVMAKFINGEADVLVSTTIIESGIDIPNANTIIIDRADRFGLSDLYQLRGRVGRYKHQAYAYLLLPRHASLLSDVRKRISAIKQYSSLGSGFKIAMRDLEIRGAGNLLGAQQSGHITAVGFDLYCQLLKQSVASMKGEKVARRGEVQIRLDFLALNPGEEGKVAEAETPKKKKRENEVVLVPRETATYSEWEETVPDEEENAKPSSRAPAYLPLNYIREAQQRISIYRKLAQAIDKGGVEEIRRELRDRFGPLPGAVELLLVVTELKILASDKRISAIETEGAKLKLFRNKEPVLLGGKFPRMTKKEPKAKLNEIKKVLLAF